MEVQTSSVSCSRSHSWQVSELAANPGLTVSPPYGQPLCCYSAKHPQNPVAHNNHHFIISHGLWGSRTWEGLCYMVLAHDPFCSCEQTDSDWSEKERSRELSGLSSFLSPPLPPSHIISGPFQVVAPCELAGLPDSMVVSGQPQAVHVAA